MPGRKPPSKGRRPAAQRRDGDAGHGVTPETEALHRAANQCHATFAYVATERRHVDDLEDLLCLVDCAEVCTTTAGIVARKGHYAQPLRDLCAQQVQDVASTCRRFPEDEILGACAATLRDAHDALTAQLVDGE
jgi:predicted TIM-barrel enzyme